MVAEGRHHLCAEIDSAAIVAAAGGSCCSYTIICACFENANIVIDSNVINGGSGIGSRGRHCRPRRKPLTLLTQKQLDSSPDTARTPVSTLSCGKECGAAGRHCDSTTVFRTLILSSLLLSGLAQRVPPNSQNSLDKAALCNRKFWCLVPDL